MKKIIHRFWGGSQIPPDYDEFGKRWAELNPDWDVILWSDRGSGTLFPTYVSNPSGEKLLPHMVMNRRVWYSLNTPPSGMTVDTVAMWTQRADVIGYELVYTYGGLYVNTDIEPVKPMSALFEMYPQLEYMDAAAMEDDQWIVNAVLWSPEPRSEFYSNVINMLAARYFSMENEYMNVTTGPHLLTSVYNLLPHLLVPIDKDVFSWVHWSQVAVGSNAVVDYSELPKQVVGIHHWGHRKNQRAQTSWIV